MTGPLGFLTASTAPGALHTPERVPEDDQLIAHAIGDFVDREVLPRADALETGDLDILRLLFSLAADVGLTGIAIPERYGGVGASIRGTMLAAAELGRQESFAAAIGAHICIGSLPLVLFGSDELKERYLPDLASGHRIGAYALTEPDAGSDALAVRTRAVSVGEGGWRLTGEKQFITNAGIAGLYTVFARAEGDAFTAFVVPSEAPGVTPGRPESKMGLRGSLTAPLSLRDTPTPRGHLLGTLGKGHRVAFNALNLGRIKMGFGSLGASREALAQSACYAAERHQFGRPIGELQLVAAKLAGMASRVFLLEGVCHRVAGALDEALPDGLGDTPPERLHQVLRSHAVASAMLKLLGSELLSWVADEAVQLHGGYGFIEDYGVCRLYRDVRVNRLFEGTNEVNRLIVGGAVLGDTDRAALLDHGRGDAPGAAPGLDALCADLRWTLGRVVAAAHEQRAVGQANREHTDQLVLAGIADLTLELFALDTAAARVAGRVPTNTAHDEALLLVSTEDARARIVATLVPLMSRLAAPNLPELVTALTAGATDAVDARQHIARAALDSRGTLP